MTYFFSILLFFICTFTCFGLFVIATAFEKQLGRISYAIATVSILLIFLILVMLNRAAIESEDVFFLRDTSRLFNALMFDLFSIRCNLLFMVYGSIFGFLGIAIILVIGALFLYTPMFDWLVGYVKDSSMYKVVDSRGWSFAFSLFITLIRFNYYVRFKPGFYKWLNIVFMHIKIFFSEIIHMEYYLTPTIWLHGYIFYILFFTFFFGFYIFDDHLLLILTLKVFAVLVFIELIIITIGYVKYGVAFLERFFFMLLFFTILLLYILYLARIHSIIFVPIIISIFFIKDLIFNGGYIVFEIFFSDFPYLRPYQPIMVCMFFMLFLQSIRSCWLTFSNIKKYCKLLKAIYMQIENISFELAENKNFYTVYIALNFIIFINLDGIFSIGLGPWIGHFILIFSILFFIEHVIVVIGYVRHGVRFLKLSINILLLISFILMCINYLVSINLYFILRVIQILILAVLSSYMVSK